MNVAEDGIKLFGAITTSQFTESVINAGVEIDSKFVKLPKIKKLGSYEAEIRINRSISTNIPFQVIAK